MSERTTEAIRAAIGEAGPIGFDAFMELALYGPDGFYDQPPIGAEGDFVTSPHIHPVFGELVATGVAGLAERLQLDASVAVVEAGAGDGTLGAQMVRALGPRVRYAAVERSAGARRAIEQRGLRTAARLADVAPIQGVIVANELLDNLPFRRVVMEVSGVREVLIDLEGDEIVQVLGPVGDDIAHLVPDGLAPGEDAAVPTGAIAWIAELSAALERGYALLIDYAASTGRRHVHGYRGRRVIEDVLAHPGKTDITAGLDLDTVTRAAERESLRVDASTTQRAALLSLGLQSWIRNERVRQTELRSQGRGMDAVRSWSERSRATLLAEPGGLGGLRWMLLATRDAPFAGDVLVAHPAAGTQRASTPKR